MQDFKLFPKKENLMIGVVLGLVFLAIGQHAIRYSMEDGSGQSGFPLVIGLALLAFGVQAVIGSALRLWRPRPVFEANQDGFSVLGKAPQPWDRFQGAFVHTVRFYRIFPLIRWIVIRVGKGRVFSTRRHIKWIYLPGPAAEVERTIMGYAMHAQAAIRGQEDSVFDAIGPISVSDIANPNKPTAKGFSLTGAAEPGPAPVGPKFAPLKPQETTTTDNLIKDVPTLVERIFGRKSTI